MDGVELNPLKVISHPKGDILHGIKSSSEGFSSFGEAYFSTINHLEVKGWKLHKKMVLNFVVPVGEVEFVVFDEKEYFTITLSKNNYKRLTISPNLWVAFRGKSNQTNLVVNIASIEHNPNESVNVDLDSIAYDWK
tara:strand:+ start:3274 stop:3681 length:408 start_codon:yes stop_codon:yes gene_type:complete